MKNKTINTSTSKKILYTFIIVLLFCFFLTKLYSWGQEYAANKYEVLE